jgi:hypothetical protein
MPPCREASRFNLQLLGRTKALHSLFNEQAPFAEARGRLTDATIQALDEASVFDFYMPRGSGGLEILPMEALEVETLSYGDASTAWSQWRSRLQAARQQPISCLPPERRLRLRQRRAAFLVIHTAASCTKTVKRGRRQTRAILARASSSPGPRMPN